MIRRAKLWFYGSLVFALLNAGGAWYAGRMGDGSHATTHVVLMVLGLVVAWWVRGSRPGGEATETPAAPLFDERLDRIEQSLDAIAVEVERVGEGQRFVTKLGQQMKENNSR
jgi:hypothetical protein